VAVVRELRESEHAEAGEVTAQAYAEFATGEPRWNSYVDHLADVSSRSRRAQVLGAFLDGRVVGTVTLELEQRVYPDSPPLAPDEAHIRMLGVHPDYRRRGVARALIEASVEAARQRGKKVLTLHTAERMQAAQRLYEALDFSRGPDEDYAGMRLLCYRLDLEALANSGGQRRRA
jgi:ribosomal protein S18 acetylase RimI-like enzyme